MILSLSTTTGDLAQALRALVLGRLAPGDAPEAPASERRGKQTGMAQADEPEHGSSGKARR